MKNRTVWMVAAATALVSVAAFAGPVACGRGGHGHRGLVQDGEVDVERLRHGAKWVLSSADPTDEQLDRAVEIAAAALLDFSDMKGDREAQHARIIAALSGDAIDRAELEAMRSEMLQKMDAGSQRGLDAFVQFAEVFTPEQRAQLLEEAESHRGRGHGRWR